MRLDRKRHEIPKLLFLMEFSKRTYSIPMYQNNLHVCGNQENQIESQLNYKCYD